MNNQANQETVPATFDVKAFRSIERASCGLRVSPLARAALDNGVSFEDVQAYVESMAWVDDAHRSLLAAKWYEACNVPSVAPATPALAAHVTEMVTDTVLEGALLRSVLAIGTIEHARLWWLGVL